MYLICQRLRVENFLVLILCSLMLFSDARAHTYTTLNEYQIDRANDTASTSILQLQVFLADMFKQKHMSDRWPELKLMAIRDDMAHQKEEAEMGIEYFLSTGINIQSQEALVAKPVAGRTVAASQMVDTAYALIKHMETLENQQAFIKEIYTGGQSAYMYNLITSQREKMELYRTIFNSVPAPTAAAAPAVQTAVIPVLLYLFGGLGLCALVTIILKTAKPAEPVAD